MPTVEHIERHFTGSEFIRDIVIGMPELSRNIYGDFFLDVSSWPF